MCMCVCVYVSYPLERLHFIFHIPQCQHRLNWSHYHLPKMIFFFLLMMRESTLTQAESSFRIIFYCFVFHSISVIKYADSLSRIPQIINLFPFFLLPLLQLGPSFSLKNRFSACQLGSITSFLSAVPLWFFVQSGIPKVNVLSLWRGRVAVL